MDVIYIGPVPCEEACAQLGVTPDFSKIARIEMQAYIKALRSKYGEEPAGARLTIKWEQHDFGTYGEVVCKYDENSEEATEYAFNCETGLATWEEAGMSAPVIYQDGDSKHPTICEVPNGQ